MKSPKKNRTPLPRWKRWLKRLMWGAIVTFALLGIFTTWVMTTCFAEPPTLASRPAILDVEMKTEASGRQSLGTSWFIKRPGHSILHLQGDPFTIGYANAKLTAELLAQQERALFNSVETFLPNRVALYTAALLVLVHNRNLPDYVTDEYKLEIFGLAHNRDADPFPQFGSRYHRILNYHAAHDISHWIWGTPAIGCTSFAAVGGRTADGHLLSGRNFDWESGGHFDTNKVIALYRPEKGHAFLSVSWPGMAGAVTGLNDAKIYCSINGAHTEHMGLGVGRPVSLVAREVLQYSSDLDSAIRVIRNAAVFVADTFLLADGKTGEAVVVEKTPKSSAVRRMHNGLLLQSNHFETAELCSDVGNLRYMQDGTTIARRQRLAELLGRHSGKLDPGRVAQILRDRLGVGDVDRGLGHRNTINPMIATHSVIADVTAGILWVSRGRHQLGSFDAYSIENFGGTVAKSIPEDPQQLREYRDLTRFRALFAQLDSRLESGQTLDADFEAKLVEAERLNPLSPEILRLRGSFAQRAGELATALKSFRAALAAQPAFREDRESLAADIRGLSAQLEKQP